MLGRGSGPRSGCPPDTTASLPVVDELQAGVEEETKVESCVNFIVPPVKFVCMSGGTSAVFPMFYKQSGGVFSHDFLNRMVDD